MSLCTPDKIQKSAFGLRIESALSRVVCIQSALTSLGVSVSCLVPLLPRGHGLLLVRMVCLNFALHSLQKADQI